MLSVQSYKCREGWLQSLPRQLHMLEVLLQLTWAEHGLMARINQTGESSLKHTEPSWQGVHQMLKQVYSVVIIMLIAIVGNRHEAVMVDAPFHLHCECSSLLCLSGGIPTGDYLAHSPTKGPFDSASILINVFSSAADI